MNFTISSTNFEVQAPDTRKRALLLHLQQNNTQQTATGCHFTGPVALRRSLSAVLLNIQFNPFLFRSSDVCYPPGKCSASRHSAFHGLIIASSPLFCQGRTVEKRKIFAQKRRAARLSRPPGVLYVLCAETVLQLTQQPWLPPPA